MQRRSALITEETQRLRDVVLQVRALDDGIQEAMLQQKFATLEPLGELLPDGLLDHARPGEADQRAGLGNIQVAQHGEARGYAAGGRVREHADVGNASVV